MPAVADRPTVPSNRLLEGTWSHHAEHLPRAGEPTWLPQPSCKGIMNKSTTDTLRHCYADLEPAQAFAFAAPAVPLAAAGAGGSGAGAGRSGAGAGAVVQVLGQQAPLLPFWPPYRLVPSQMLPMAAGCCCLTTTPAKLQRPLNLWRVRLCIMHCSVLRGKPVEAVVAFGLGGGGQQSLRSGVQAQPIGGEPPYGALVLLCI